MGLTEGRGDVARRWHGVIWILLIIASWVGFSGSASAATPMEVSADEYSVWDGSRLFIAQGNVTVRYREALITADMLQYDADTDYAVFSGNVVYLDDEQELTGHTLQYDLKDGVALLDGMDAVLYSDGVDGPMFISGERVRATDDHVRIQRAELTTCECEGDTPAYHFAAKELEIYPNDRIVVRSVVFYDHKVPLLYLPYLTLSLKENTSRFDMPQIGYSERTGWYIKLTYNYVLKSGLYGALLFDYYQKLGPGGGVRHTYVDTGPSLGTLYVYGVGNEFGGTDGSFAWERRWRSDPWDVRANYAYDVRTSPWGIERESLLGKGSIERTTSGGTALFEGEYRLDTGPNPIERLAASGRLRQRLADGWNLRLSGETFDERRPDLPATHERRRWIGYSGELERVTPGYTLLTRVARQYNPDLKDEEINPGTLRWDHVSRMPEVLLKLRRMAGLDVQLGAVRLKEDNVIEAWRGEAEVGLATRTWRPLRPISFNVNGSVRGLAYTTDHRQFTFQYRTGMNVQIARPLSATLQYNYRNAWGETPFRFDRVSPAETLSPRLNWRSGAVTASVSTTYNLLSERWNNVTGNATIRLSRNLMLRGSGTYDLEGQTFRRLAGTVDWRINDDSAVKVGGVYDVPTESWQRIDADINLAVTKNWKAGVTAIYDVPRNTFSRNHMYLSHNACDCREIRLRYDQTRREIWLEYHITAFPSSRVALGSGEDALMFESDALTDILKN